MFCSRRLTDYLAGRLMKCRVFRSLNSFGPTGDTWGRKSKCESNLNFRRLAPEVLEDRRLLSVSTAVSGLLPADVLQDAVIAGEIPEAPLPAVSVVPASENVAAADRAESAAETAVPQSASQTKLTAAATGSTDSAYYIGTYLDADKTGSGDSELCWAATAANMLYYTGWANESDGFASEDDVLAYYTYYFENAAGVPYYGLNWFFSGIYPGSSPSQKVPGGGGLYKDVTFSSVCSNVNLCTVKGNKITSKAGEKIYLLSDALEAKCGCSITIGWYNAGEIRSGGHSITIWGFTYDETQTPKSGAYYTGVIISNSDDDSGRGTSAPDTLEILGISWDDANGYYTFDTFGRSSTQYGILESFTVLACSEWFEPTEAYSTVVTTCDDIINPNDGKISIREAIANAGKNGLENRVTFDSSLDNGTISLNAEIKTVDSVTIDAGALEHGITFSANQTASVFKVKLDADEELTLTGAVLTGGESDYGGGIYLYSGRMTLSSVTVAGNNARYGGGICVYQGTAVLNSVTVLSNTAQQQGGGVYVVGSGTVLMTGGTISKNSAFQGGGVNSSGNVTMDSVEILLNQASLGAGLLLVNGTVLLTAVTISKNTAQTEGGGIRLDAGTLTVKNSTISGNNAGSGYVGGGLSLLGGTAHLYETSFFENTASAGGGIYTGGILTMEGGTISGNTASTSGGGGLYVTDTGSAVLTRVIIMQNSAVQGGGIACLGQLTMSGVIVANNQMLGTEISYWLGGGIFISGGNVAGDGVMVSGNTAQMGGGIYISTAGSLELTRSVIEKNNALQGGGIYTSGTVRLETAVIAENTLSGKTELYWAGGGLNIAGGSVTGINLTVTNNTGSIGVGIYCNAALNLYNSIVLLNQSPYGSIYGDIYGDSGSAVKGFDTLSSYTNWINPDVPPVYDPNKPLFADWKNGDYSILADSQAVDAGNSEYATTDTDLADNDRIYNGQVDLGAFENQGGTPLAGIALTGAVQVGGTLTVHLDPADADVTYLWYRGTNPEEMELIENAAESAYTITEADLGCYLKAVAEGRGDTTGSQTVTTQTAVIEPIELYFLQESYTAQEGTVFYAQVRSNSTKELTYYWAVYNADEQKVYSVQTASGNVYLDMNSADAGSYRLEVYAESSDGVQSPSVSAELELTAKEPVICVQMTEWNQGTIVKLNLDFGSNMTAVSWSILWESDSVEKDGAPQVIDTRGNHLSAAHYYQPAEISRDVFITLDVTAENSQLKTETFSFSIARLTIIGTGGMLTRAAGEISRSDADEAARETANALSPETEALLFEPCLLSARNELPASADREKIFVEIENAAFCPVEAEFPMIDFIDAQTAAFYPASNKADSFAGPRTVENESAEETAESSLFEDLLIV